MAARLLPEMFRPSKSIPYPWSCLAPTKEGMAMMLPDNQNLLDEMLIEVLVGERWERVTRVHPHKDAWVLQRIAEELIHEDMQEGELTGQNGLVYRWSPLPDDGTSEDDYPDDTPLDDDTAGERPTLEQVIGMRALPSLQLLESVYQDAALGVRPMSMATRELLEGQEVRDDCLLTEFGVQHIARSIAARLLYVTGQADLGRTLKRQVSFGSEGTADV